MARLLRVPEVAANATEAVLQAWSVELGSEFAAQDTLATMETEKAVVDVEAEEAGVVLRALVPAGSQVSVGTPIALLGDPGEEVDDIEALLDELGVSAEQPVVAPERRIVPDGTESSPADAGERVFASPLARRLAREAGLSVEELAGTGPGNRIVRRDVETAIAARPAQGPPTNGAHAATAQRPARPATAPAEFTEVAHSRMRQAIASRLTQSKQTVPHFYLRGTARVKKLLKLRAELNAGGSNQISVNDLVIKAASRAHTLVPEMNVVWTPAAVRTFAAVDVSVAVATERGLVTPVLRGVDSMSVSSVAANVRDLVERARSGALRQDELEGGSLTVTNLGMFGTEEFAAIINPPQAAILAVGAARQEPVVRHGKLKAGTVMRVTLSADHRAVDGALAARWMTAFLATVEKPIQILA